MNQNENSPRVDISTALPLGVGIISLFGICLLLIANRLASPRAVVEVPDTATPFHYLFLGTEPGISSPVPDEDIIGTRSVGFSVTAYSGFSGADSDSVDAQSTRPTPTRRVTRTPTESSDTLLTSTATRTPLRATRSPTAGTSAITTTPIALPSLPGSTATFASPATLTPTSRSGPPLEPGTYDDTDSLLTYTGNWVSQTGQPGAEEGTLHVSSTLNNTLTFRFYGEQLRIVYQSGGSLGTMTVLIDGTPFPDLYQYGSPSTRSEWAVAGLNASTHTVTITHSGGGSVNIDQIIIPALTVTPLPTATATSTSSP